MSDTLPTLASDRVTLRPMDESAVPLVARWFSDPEFTRQQWGAYHGPMSLEGARDWWSRFTPPGGGAFALQHDGRTVGFANFRRLNERHGNADVGIGIGEQPLWGKGLGTEALRLLLGYLLDGRGLHRVRLHVTAANDRAIASYKKCGFELEGIERDGVRAEDGGWRDMAVMGLVRGRRRPDFDPAPVTLEGTHVRLEPLRMEHAEELFAAADEDEIWTYLSRARPGRVADMRTYIREALDQQVLDRHLPWLTRRVADGLAIGTTRYANIDRANRTVEIGWTLLSSQARRSAANTEAKLLQLRHAFETLGALRVWLQTDILNERSRRAIERIGARQEGALRNERILPDGRLRTTVIYSFIRDEWPEAGRRLEALLAQ